MAAMLSLLSACDDKSACDDCTGCCQDGQCVEGTIDIACGTGGMNCITCPTGQRCQLGQCVNAQAISCGTTGCVDSTGGCQPGFTPQACGTGGGSCQVCGAGQQCRNGICQDPCSFASCPSGCCDSGGNCITSVSALSCGTNGSSCQSCGSGSCVAGQCSTGSGSGCSDCGSGCCTQNQCVPGTTSLACGVGGGTCAVCSAGQACVSGICSNVSVCNSTNCSGCCDASGRCVELFAQGGNTCGSRGAACHSCSGGETCVQGQCSADQECFRRCPVGCCTPSGQCIAINQQSKSTCGKDGSQCGSCSGACLDGVCLSENPRWNMRVLSLLVEDTNQGLPWDGDFVSSGPLPDVKVEARLDNEFLYQALMSSAVTDSAMPIVTDSNAVSWTRPEVDLITQTVQIRVFDQDGISNDEIGVCELEVSITVLESGTWSLFSCATNVKQIDLEFSRQ